MENSSLKFDPRFGHVDLKSMCKMESRSRDKNEHVELHNNVHTQMSKNLNEVRTNNMYPITFAH